MGDWGQTSRRGFQSSELAIAFYNNFTAFTFNYGFKSKGIEFDCSIGEVIAFVANIEQ